MNVKTQAFAFAAKPEAALERSRAGTTMNDATSDNDGYEAYAHDAAFALALADPRICARFWSHVDTEGPFHPVLGTRCWLWTANVTGRGHKTHPFQSRHGQFTYRVDGRGQQYHVYAHRFAWGLAHGPIPPGLQVLHRCDVPPCVVDGHLFPGTQDDNIKDAARKQRLTVPRTRRLSLAERLAIYQTPAYLGVVRDLARTYHVTHAAISLIRRGRFLGSGVWAGTKTTTITVRRSA